MTIVNAWSNNLIQSCTVHDFFSAFLDLCWKFVFILTYFFLDVREMYQQTEKILRIKPLSYPVYITCVSFTTL